MACTPHVYFTCVCAWAYIQGGWCRSSCAEHSHTHVRRVQNNLHKHMCISVMYMPNLVRMYIDLYMNCTPKMTYVYIYIYKLYEHVLVLRHDYDYHCDTRHKCYLEFLTVKLKFMYHIWVCTTCWLSLVILR